MSWADKVKATALAALAERTATAARFSVDTPWSWNPHEVWLTRVRQPRRPTARSSIGEPSTPPRQDAAASDLIPRS
jgi:hypothetical protein